MEILYGFIIGIIASLSASLIWHFVFVRMPSRSSVNPGNISGVWISSKFKQIGFESTTIEILKISQRGDTLRLYIEGHNQKRSHPLVILGDGKIRGNKICAHYWVRISSSPEIGTFNLRLISDEKANPILHGTYTQIFERQNLSDLEPKQYIYEAKRLQLNWYRQLKLFLGKTYFGQYSDVEMWLKKLDKLPENSRTEQTP